MNLAAAPASPLEVPVQVKFARLMNDDQVYVADHQALHGWLSAHYGDDHGV